MTKTVEKPVDPSFIKDTPLEGLDLKQDSLGDKFSLHYCNSKANELFNANLSNVLNNEGQGFV
jgi:hypothetical protein